MARPGRPARRTGRGPPHLPLRPLWLCRARAAPWPCATARLCLVSEYAHDLVALSVHLCTVRHGATADLHRLHPHAGPDPPALFARLLAWMPRRRQPFQQ
ncbi:hypothetical protein ACL02O_11540 [Micromonospora sp. MS34]|uniref:hypothetical protein n=1 Tax=Micromonospora sp. MS34 TaxID=3385971 RepID=UPI0039A08ACA